MAKTDANKFIDDNKNAIIIVAAIIVLATAFMFFRDRQQKRDFRLERLDTQMELWEERGPQQRNTKTANDDGRIL